MEAQEFEEESGRSASERAFVRLREAGSLLLRTRVEELEKLLAASRQEVADWEDGKLYR